MNWESKTIDQFVHTLQYGDAISGEVLTIQRVLQSLGASSSIYALNTHELLEGKSLPMEAYKPESGSALIHHYSIGSVQNERFASQEGVRKALVYHNLTPVHWYESYNQKVSAGLNQGKDELPGLIEKS